MAALFNMFASVKLAVICILSLAVLLGLGTVLESLHDAETASHYVYGTWWFFAVLGLLGANVFFAALSRWPWRRRHCGFLITHLGILILLYGALVTLLYGREGKVVLGEGESAERFTLKEERLFLLDPSSGVPREFPVRFRFSPPGPERPYQVEALEGVRIQVLDYLPNSQAYLRVTEGGEKENPALEVTLSGSAGTIQEWLLPRMEERRRISLGPAQVRVVELPSDSDSLEHLLGAGEADGQGRLVAPGQEAGNNELVLGLLPDGKVKYAVRAGENWKSGVYSGEPVKTGWMDFAFDISRTIAKATVQKQFRRVATPKGKTGPPPAILMRIERGEMTQEFWLGRGEQRILWEEEGPLQVAYGLKSLPLGFEIKLDDFRIETYQGTRDPAAFESAVRVAGGEGGQPRPYRIYMNHPLQFGPYTIYQSGYQLSSSGSDISIFTVAFDPGVPFKYAGALVMVVGSVLLFFLRIFYSGNKRASPTMASEKALVMKPEMKWASFLLLLIGLWAFPTALRASPMPQPKPEMPVQILKDIPLLDGGRIKPLDSFARETVRAVTGKERWAGFDPLDLILSWLTQTKEWESVPLLEASRMPSLESLGIDAVDKRIAPSRLKENQEFQLLVQTALAAQQQDARLSNLERETLNLMYRLNLFYSVASGSSLFLVPEDKDSWRNLNQLAEKLRNTEEAPGAFSNEAEMAAQVQKILAAYHRGDSVQFEADAEALKKTLRRRGEGLGNYPSSSEMKREEHFNSFQPFLWAWLGYAAAFFVLMMSLWVEGKLFYRIGLAMMAGATAVQGYGFYLRCMISGRAPVTNMYETVVWVSLGIAILAMVLEWLHRPRYYVVVGSAMAALGLILAGSAPGVLDPTIKPLVPVLRDNFWLTVHVLTITLSYAAFALALGVGHLIVGNYIFRPKAEERIRHLNHFLYRAIQVGVVLLAAGIFLGGVWANYSWGRFWGWDPKEVWALIALLGYLGIIHGRFAGWLKGFGFAVGAILAFLLILMAWYGVNFILGVGLHSYGFSTGGMKFVTIFVFLELLWVGFAILRYRNTAQASLTSPQDLSPSTTSAS